MRGAALALVMWFVALAAMPLSVWHDVPVGADAGFHRLDSLGDVDRATIHVRAAADSKNCREWGIIWNYTDAANYMKATLRLPADGEPTDLYASEATVEVTRCEGGLTETVSTRRFGHEIADGRGMNSLKLVYDGGVATLYTGSTDQTEVGTVAFDRRGGLTAFFCDAPVKVRRAEVRSHSSAPVRMSDFSTVDALAAHIRASSDPMESFWEYLDRDTDASRAEIGGRYMLATVRNADGYDIIYIKGSEMGSRGWRPMQLKGRLTPTIFRDNYDMEWITADMHSVAGDTDAQLSDDKAVLTLRFPELGAQLRLRRKPL